MDRCTGRRNVTELTVQNGVTHHENQLNNQPFLRASLKININPPYRNPYNIHVVFFFLPILYGDNFTVNIKKTDLHL